jgi:hypothetical protein
MPDINLSPYTVEQQAIDRRRRMAELLQQQAAAPMEMPSMPGVRSSPFAGLAKLLQGYGAGQTLQNVDTEQKALGEKYQTERTNQFQDLARLLSAPAQAAQPAIEPKFTEGQSTITQGGQAAVPARPAGYLPLESLSQFTHPEIQQLAMSQALSQLAPKAPIKLGPNETLYEPTTYKPLITAPGVDKNLVGLPNPSDFTPESLATFQTSKNYGDLVPKAKETNVPAAAQNYEYYVKQEKDAGRKPLSFKDFELLKVREGRAPGPVKEKLVYDAARGGTVNVDTGEFKPVKQGGVDIGVKPKDLKPVPPTINTAMTQNQVVLNKIARAEELLTKTPEATGMFKGMMPDAILNRTDKEGTATRAALAELAATKVHDLSGAAVSVSEFGRLKPFLPQPTDNADTLRTKLAGMKTEVEDIVNATNQIYSEEQGYKPIPSLAPKPTAPADAPPVTALKEGHTTTFANGQQWTLQKGKQVRVK